MYQGNKSETKTVHHFKDALNALQGKSTHYYKEPLNVVGVYLDSPYTESVLAHPQFKVEVTSDKSMAIMIMLKPTEPEAKNLKVYEQYLNYTGLGDVVMQEKSPTAPTKKGVMDIFLHQGVVTSEIQDYPLTLHFVDEEVQLTRFKLNGVDYYQYGLHYKTYLNDNEQDQTLYILLKDKESSSENFYSTLVAEELTARDLDIILSSLANQNITGLQVGAVMYSTGSLQSYTYAIHDLEIGYGEFADSPNMLNIQTAGEDMDIDLTNVKGSFVKRIGEGRYTLEIYLGNKEKIQLHIG